MVVLGGSGASTPELFDAFAAWPGEPGRRPELTVVLTGRSIEKLELVARASRLRTPAGGPAISVETCVDRRAALAGADVVLNQVRIGGLDAREFDESFPVAFGVPGEETMGPGGFANALRTLPALRDAWTDVAEVAPGALLVNLTNPSGIVVQAAEREFGLRVVSICDSPMSFTQLVADRLGASRDDVRARYVGMNHVGWFVPDTTARLSELDDLAVGLSSNDVHVQQALPAPYVRYYIRRGSILEEQRTRSGASRAEVLKSLEGTQLDAYGKDAAAAATPKRGAGWYGKAFVPLVDAWANGSPSTLILGLRNDGRIPWLAEAAVVEAAVVISTPGMIESAKPIHLPPLPTALLALHAAYESLVVDAVFDGSDVAATRALTANPMVLDTDLAARLLTAIRRDSPN